MNKPDSAKILSSSPYLFIRTEGGKALVWDYKNHKQFLVDALYLNRLIELSCETPCNTRSDIDVELESAQLIGDYTSKLSCWGWDELSHIFHVGTQNVPITNATSPTPEQWVDEYLEYCEDIAKDQPLLLTEREGPLIQLQRGDLSPLASVTLEQVLLSRKTCRSFHGNSVSLETVSTLLFAAFGMIHGEWTDLTENDLAITGMRKASPSGGGLHPEEAYLLALRVDGLEPGLYHYRCHDHALTQIKLGNFEPEMIALLWDQYYAQGMAFGVFVTARFDKAWWKYKHSRAYRNVLYDVGHVSQTFLLSATGLGLDTWLTGAFHDHAVESFLEIDGVKEGALLFLGAGHGNPVTIDETMKARLLARGLK